MKKLWLLGIAIVVALVLAACGNDEDTDNENGEEAAPEEEQQMPGEMPEQNMEVTDEERVEDDAAVATVNGNEILGDRYNPIYSQVKMQMAQFGQDVSDTDMIKDQTVTILIEQQLIREAATDEGIEVTEEEVENEYNTLREENGEQLTAVLEQFQLTEESFKQQLADDLITNKYIESEFDVEVTEEEIEEFYEQVSEQQGEDAPEYDEIKDTLRDNLEEQKIGEALQAKVEELRENADIETLI